MKINKLGIIGFGKMGQAIVKGLIKQNLLQPDQVCGCDLSVETRNYVHENLDIEVGTDPGSVVEKSDVILVAVKPFQIESVCEEISSAITPGKLLISVAAGITTTYIEKRLPKDIPVVRVMPNTPTLINEGMSVFCNGKSAKQEHADLVQHIFEAVGEVATVQENLMDAVTAISGSGPAYMFMMLEAVSDAGLKMGLKKDVATKLATQTMLGAAKLVKESGQTPVKLKDDVSTPAGVTIEGLVELENGNFRSTVINAILMASNRSSKLVEND